MTTITPADLTPDNIRPVKLETGDICVAATYAVGEPDIRRNSGAGRVLVYDKDLNLKGALWTGETGLVIGVEYCPTSKALFVSDMSSQTVKRFSADGEMNGTLLPSFPEQQGKPFSTMEFMLDGSLVIGEHIHGEKPPFIGKGDICVFDKGGKQLQRRSVEHDPGKFGFHAVTNLTLSEDESTAIYLSETGKRIMQYDLAGAKQLPDLFAFGDDGADADKFTAGIARTKDGNLLISHVYSASLYTMGGELLAEFTGIPRDRGWAALWACHDGTSFLIGHFFTGRIEKRSLENGALLGEVETGLVYKLSEICEIG
ncbi:MAG: hypothetical protein L3J05_03260 [Robiginitomaculum sp.]|nr:hypothetical protein [Robiginitomaculum sp.]